MVLIRVVFYLLCVSVLTPLEKSRVGLPYTLSSDIFIYIEDTIPTAQPSLL